MKKQRRRNLSRPAGLFLAGLWVVCSFAVRTAAQDPRFRGASISWAPTANPDEVVFHITYAARLSGSAAGLGATIPTYDFFSLNALTAPLFAHRLSVTVTAVNAAEDWFVGTNDFVWSYATYGPAGAGPFTAGIFSSCPLSTPSGVRIANLANRAGSPYIVQTQVTPLGTNRSPVSSFGPRVYVPESTHSTFLVPARDPDGDQIRWRISTDAEAGGGSSPANLTINPTNGVATWNNLGLGYTNFTAQVIIEDLDASGNPKTQCPVDFILTVVSNTVPACQIAPTNVFKVALGSSVSFQVSGANTDLGDNVTLTVSGLPAGASLTPALPLTNPTTAATTFFWAPQFADLGAHTITFTATDSTGLQSTTNVIITVIVDPNQATFITLPPPIQVESASPGGTLVPVTAHVTNTLGAPLSVQWTVDGTAVHTDAVAGLLPTTSASLTFTGNYRLGPHTVVGTASDGATPPATNTTFVTVVDTTPPVIVRCPPAQTLLLDPVSKSVTIPDLRSQVVATDNGTATSALVISQAPPPGTVVNKAGTKVLVFTVTDGSGNSSQCEASLAVVDNSAPQVFASLQVLSLWPPNHDLHCVGFSYVVSKADAVVTLQVFSDEPDVPGSRGNALGGDDRFSPDATALRNGEVVLRAERVGNGPGRVYLIVATAVDSLGQVASACKTTVVPKTPNAADVASISAMADAAEAWFGAHGAPPPGYSQVGVGPVLGPKQSYSACPTPPE